MSTKLWIFCAMLLLVGVGYVTYCLGGYVLYGTDPLWHIKAVIANPHGIWNSLHGVWTFIMDKWQLVLGLVSGVGTTLALVIRGVLNIRKRAKTTVDAVQEEFGVQKAQLETQLAEAKTQLTTVTEQHQTQMTAMQKITQESQEDYLAMKTRTESLQHERDMWAGKVKALEQKVQELETRVFVK